MNIHTIQNILNSLILFSTFTEQIMAIDTATVSEIHFYMYEAEEFNEKNEPVKFKEFILVVYKNGTTDKLPASDPNRAMANEILRKIKSSSTPS